MGTIDNDNDSDRSSPSGSILPSLYRISRLAGHATSPEEAFRAIIDAIAAFFQADRASICLINPDTGLLEPEVVRGFPDGQTEETIEPGRGVPGWVVFHNKPLLIGDFDDPGIPFVAPPGGIRCRLSVPMDDRGQVPGVITIDSKTPHRFGKAELDDLMALSLEITAVLQRLWTVEQLNVKASQLEILTNIGQSLVTKLELDELLSSLAREAQEIARSRLCTIQLYDAQSERVRLKTSYPDIVGDGGAGEWPIHETLASAPIRTRKQIEFRRLQSPDYLEMEDRPPDPVIESVLSTPILLEAEVIGVIHIFTDGTHRFTNEEKRLLVVLAGLAAVAIENARLYARVFETEESLRRNEKLTTLGLLAAEIAHEIRNPLTVLKLLFGSLNLSFPENDPRTTDAGIIREKLNQLESIVGRVLSFAKAPGTLHARWNLDEIIRETCLLIRLKLHHSKIHMHYKPPKAAVMVDANKGQIQQVLLNLLLNATEAMPDGGDITIRCTRQKDGRNSMALVDIEDTGTGIPEAIRSDIFSSFLSGRTEGTGLGLAIVKRIMQSHHGDIALLKSDSQGTTMRVSLPAL